MQPKKYVEGRDLETLIQEKRSRGLRIGLCHGVFDLVHIGHIVHFKEAKSLVDCLIVSITADAFVNKGPGRPLFYQDQRIEFLSELEVLDHVVISNNMTADTIIEQVRPDLYFKGSDYKTFEDDLTGNINSEASLVQKYGGQIHFTQGVTSSSSKLINSTLSPFNKVVYSWISEFKEKYKIQEINAYLDAISNLDVVLIGEIIIDKYTYVDALAKTTKDPLLAFHLGQTTVFAGGVLAIASNMQGWVKTLTLITCTGNSDAQLEEFIQKTNYMSVLIKTNSPNITKHRYLDKGTRQKLFETYDFDPNYFSVRDISNELPQELIQSADVVVVADYGHGMLESKALNLIASLSSFLCVNVQANAGNRGFNNFDKYSRFDFFTANSGELQIQSRKAHPDYEKLIRDIMLAKQASCAIITQGERGLTVYDRDTFRFAPALATSVIDKIGAGDSVLAISSLLVRVGAPLEIVAFVSNLVAAKEVSHLGHQKPLSLGDLKRQIKSLLS